MLASAQRGGKQESLWKCICSLSLRRASSRVNHLSTVRGWRVTWRGWARRSRSCVTMLEAHAAEFSPQGTVACRWVHAFKRRRNGENPDRALKLTAENLFVALADPSTEPTDENTRLIQFLALLLERKRVLKPRGRSADAQRQCYEHARSKVIFEVPVGELTPEFFLAVQEQLSVLVGPPKLKKSVSETPAATSEEAVASPGLAPEACAPAS